MISTRTAATAIPQPAASKTLRFPCGHLEDEKAMVPKVRAEQHAVWTSCRRCNLIVLLIDRRPRSQAGR